MTTYPFLRIPQLHIILSIELNPLELSTNPTNINSCPRSVPVYSVMMIRIMEIALNTPSRHDHIFLFFEIKCIYIFSPSPFLPPVLLKLPILITLKFIALISLIVIIYMINQLYAYISNIYIYILLKYKYHFLNSYKIYIYKVKFI